MLAIKACGYSVNINYYQQLYIYIALNNYSYYNHFVLYIYFFVCPKRLKREESLKIVFIQRCYCSIICLLSILQTSISEITYLYAFNYQFKF